MKSYLLIHAEIEKKQVILSTMFPHSLSRRMAELGVLPGAEIVLLRISPGKDLYLCQIRNAYQLILRREQAAQIFLSEKGAAER